MECPKEKTNLANCNCTYEPCVRKGKCCDCVTYHRQKGQLPACYFPSEAEKTYNRSISYFLELNR
ncbi:MAG: hypothetical protein C4534_04100 [Gaiellales bacterium]|nr:MAG: hypothetical protein C4534_04100 [Gaiellales bacterium]